MAELKNALDPILKVLLRQITTLLDKRSMDLIVVGGESLNAYFEDKPIFATHDYDLRLTHKDVEVMHNAVSDPEFVKIYKELEKQRNLTFDYLLRQLNKIIDETKIPQLLEKRGFELVKSEDGFFYEDTSEKQLKFRRSIVYLFRRDGEEVMQETIVDYVIYTPAHFSQFLDFVGLASQPIPFITIDGLKYATIPFIMWDTLRMMHFTEERGDPKYERYRDKYLEILRALDTSAIRCQGVEEYLRTQCDDDNRATTDSLMREIGDEDLSRKLSCESLTKLAEKCATPFMCRIDGDDLTPSELVELGIDLGLWPDTSQWRDRMLEEFNERYLCDVIKRTV